MVADVGLAKRVHDKLAYFILFNMVTRDTAYCGDLIGYTQYL